MSGGHQEAGHLSSPSDPALDSNADYSIEQEPKQPKQHIEGLEEIDRSHFQDPQHQAVTDQEADPGGKVDLVRDDYPALIGLYHALGLGERGPGGTQ